MFRITQKDLAYAYSKGAKKFFTGDLFPGGF